MEPDISYGSKRRRKSSASLTCILTSAFSGVCIGAKVLERKKRWLCSSYALPIKSLNKNPQPSQISSEGCWVLEHKPKDARFSQQLSRMNQPRMLPHALVAFTITTSLGCLTSKYMSPQTRPGHASGLHRAIHQLHSAAKCWFFCSLHLCWVNWQAGKSSFTPEFCTYCDQTKPAIHRALNYRSLVQFESSWATSWPKCSWSANQVSHKAVRFRSKLWSLAGAIPMLCFARLIQSSNLHVFALRNPHAWDATTLPTASLKQLLSWDVLHQKHVGACYLCLGRITGWSVSASPPSFLAICAFPCFCSNALKRQRHAQGYKRTYTFTLGIGCGGVICATSSFAINQVFSERALSYSSQRSSSHSEPGKVVLELIIVRYEPVEKGRASWRLLGMWKFCSRKNTTCDHPVPLRLTRDLEKITCQCSFDRICAALCQKTWCQGLLADLPFLCGKLASPSCLAYQT